MQKTMTLRGLIEWVDQKTIRKLIRYCNHKNGAIYLCNIHYVKDNMMSISTVFTNNRSQAVRLPADVRLPEDVKQVTVRAKGKERIIAPLESSWDSFFMSDTQATDDFMADRATQTQPEREALD
jgi:antitoxin VapB